MALFAVCLLGALKLLGVIEVPIQWLIIGCGIALLFDFTRRSKRASA